MPYMARIDPFISPGRSVSARMESLFRDSSPDLDAVKYERVRPIGDVAIAPVMPQSCYRERYARMKQMDHDRDVLIEDLLRQVESGPQQLQQLQLSYSRGAKDHHELKSKADALQHEIDSMRALLDRNSYVTVLIDGDALTFPKAYLTRGEQGGLQASKLLTDAIREFATNNIPHLNLVNLNVKLFLNTRAVTDTLIRGKIVDSSATFDGFLRGLLRSDATWDVVDTSLVKGLTATKIKESYRHDFINVHCHQIFLAALADPELDALLDETPDIPVHERVTLLEANGIQARDRFEHEIQSLSFDSVLCKLAPQKSPQAPPAKVASPALARVETNSSSKTISSAQGSATSTPALTWAAMTAQPLASKASENRSSTSTPVSTSKTPPLPHATTTVPRNKHGQRVDAVDTSIPYQELQRIKRMKLCNVFYLQGKPACPGGCNHSHTYPLKAAEKNVLKEVARMTPCHFRTDCDDPSCIYGHRCPQSKPHKMDCYYKEECRFYGWGHGIDDKVVKVHNVK